MSDIKKVVLAYSGGLDTSVILKWLQDVYKCEVVTFTADLGQGEELEPARAKALKAGIKSKNIYIDDLREEFVRDFVFPMFRANTVYEGEYLLGTSIARPLIAKRLIEIVNETGADAICHGATGKGNDQVRFELGAYALKPGIKVIAPWREWDLMSREKLMAYAEKHGIEIDMKHKKGGSPYSMDANLLHISYEGRHLENPAAEAEESMWRWTVSPEKAPNKAEYLDLEFAQGDVVAINGKKMKAHEVLGTLNEIGGKHGIGRLDLVENRYVGMWRPPRCWDSRPAQGPAGAPGAGMRRAARRRCAWHIQGLWQCLWHCFLQQTTMACIHCIVCTSTKFCTAAMALDLFRAGPGLFLSRLETRMRQKSAKNRCRSSERPEQPRAHAGPDTFGGSCLIGLHACTPLPSQP